jgi:hypothetical protein
MYGKGVQVIQADPGMVVKTKTADGAARVYINICTCPKVQTEWRVTCFRLSSSALLCSTARLAVVSSLGAATASAAEASDVPQTHPVDRERERDDAEMQAPSVS